MNEDDWEEAYPTLLWWTQQRTPDSVSMAWQLLDRLVDEEAEAAQAAAAVDSFRSLQRRRNQRQSYLETHWLNRVIEVSRLVTVNDKDGNSNSVPRLAVGPMEWLGSIDRYHPYLVPNVATYTMIMNSLTKWSKEPTTELVESLLNRIIEDERHQCSMELDVGVFNAVLYAWANNSGRQLHDHAAQRAEAVFERIRGCDLEPDVISYSTLITVHARASHKSTSAALRAEELLRLMVEDEVEPNTVVYNAILKAWECSSLDDSPQRADALFREMMAMYYQDGNDNVRPDAITFGRILRKLTFSGHIARADSILRQMQQMYHDGELNAKPTRGQFDAILHRWPTPYVKTPNAGERAESLLRFMNGLYLEGDDTMKPSVGNFGAVIAAWTRAADPNAAAHAEAILTWMLEFDDDQMAPDTMICTSIISAWSKSRDPSAPERAEALFQRMREWYKAGNENVKPNVITYNAVMKVWAKSRLPNAVERIEAIMRQMGDEGGIHPDRVSYNQLINAYANSTIPNAPERAESILRHLYAQHQAGDENLKPDLVGFTTVMKCWANSSDRKAGRRAESFLRYMQEAYQETGDDEIKPNAVCYTMAIRAWINSGEPGAAERAGSLLEEVNALHRGGEANMKVKKQTFFDVMTVLAGSKTVDAGQMAERILLEMQERTEGGDWHMQPSTKFFNLAIRAWCNSGRRTVAAMRAESILDLLHELHHRSLGNGHQRRRSDDRHLIKANRLSFNFVIKAWSKSGDVFAGKRCEKHLQRMQELAKGGDPDVEPDFYTFGDLSRAWARSGHADAKEKARMYASMSHRLKLQQQENGDHGGND